jgi:flagellar hook-associated protein 2
MATTLFTGASRYSQDFAAVIERQVGIASLRLTQMQQIRVKSNDEISALRAVDGKVTALQSTLPAIEDAITKRAWQATSSDTTAVTTSYTDGAAAGSWSLRVISLGAFANSVSTGKIADPGSGDFVTSAAGSLTLKVKNLDSGTTTDRSVTISGNTLQAVVDSINGTAGLNVRAAIVNLGSTSAPSYALSLQSTTYGKFSLQLQDDGGDLMSIPADTSDVSLGSLVEYKINGTTVKSDSRTVTLAPKLTAELLKADDKKDITVTVSQGTSSLQAAVNTFVSAYNAVLDELDTHTVKGGALVGNSVVATITKQLTNAVSTATGSGSLGSMAKIGLEFTSTGRLSFNSALFAAETKGKLPELQSLIGTAATSGFMKVATDSLKAIDNAKGGGFLEGTITALASSLRAEDARIEAEQSRVEQFTRDLQDRLAKADAMIAALEQQASYFNNMFEAMRANQKSMS